MIVWFEEYCEGYDRGMKKKKHAEEERRKRKRRRRGGERERQEGVLEVTTRCEEDEGRVKKE